MLNSPAYYLHLLLLPVLDITNGNMGNNFNNIVLTGQTASDTFDKHVIYIQNKGKLTR